MAKPYEFIGFGAMDVTKPYEFIGFGAMDVTKPYEDRKSTRLNSSHLVPPSPPQALRTFRDRRGGVGEGLRCL